MKALTTLVLIVLGVHVFGQQHERYLTSSCNCYINQGRNPLEGFVPSHREVDEMMLILKNIDTLKYLSDTSKYLLTVTGYVIKERRVISLYFDFNPSPNGLKKTDGQTEMYFDLETKKFYDKEIIGG